MMAATALLALAPLNAAAAPPRACELQFPTVMQTECGGYAITMRPFPSRPEKPVTLDLALHRHHHLKARDLIAPAGAWHGLQPFSFAATDFARGADRSTYGRARTLPIHGTTDALRIQVDDARPGAAGTWQGGRLRLRLSIARKQ